MLDPNPDDGTLLAELISTLGKAAPESRIRLYQTLGTFYEIEGRQIPRGNGTSQPPESRFAPSYGGNEPTSAKDFMMDKQPQTDVERVACLAYYLTHFAQTPQFGSLELSKLNTDAAQPKFASPSVTVSNATQLGYLAPAPGGRKQLSAAGERFVMALPDRVAARSVMKSAKRRSKKRNQDKPREEE